MNLPALPESAELVTPDAAVEIERRLATAVAHLDDPEIAVEWLARADALATYLRDKEAKAPMVGAMRRIEARIGELLGPAKVGRPGKETLKRIRVSLGGTAGSDEVLRHQFRALAALVDRGLLSYDMDGEDSPWRSTREGLILYERWQSLGGLKQSTSVEWYTPAKYIDAARDVMGGIDLDPASSPMANETVRATDYFTVDDDGLTHDWRGRIWCNPPYGKGTGLFASKLVEEYDAGHTTAAVFLINAYGFDTDWFVPLWAHPICFTDHRVEFTSPQRKAGGAANGNIFVYLGPDPARFADVFRQFGHVVREWP